MQLSAAADDVGVEMMCARATLLGTADAGETQHQRRNCAGGGGEDEEDDDKEKEK